MIMLQCLPVYGEPLHRSVSTMIINTGPCAVIVRLLFWDTLEVHVCRDSTGALALTLHQASVLSAFRELMSKTSMLRPTHLNLKHRKRKYLAENGTPWTLNPSRNPYRSPCESFYRNPLLSTPKNTEYPWNLQLQSPNSKNSPATLPFRT